MGSPPTGCLTGAADDAARAAASGLGRELPTSAEVDGGGVALLGVEGEGDADDGEQRQQCQHHDEDDGTTASLRFLS